MELPMTATKQEDGRYVLNISEYELLLLENDIRISNTHRDKAFARCSAGRPNAKKMVPRLKINRVIEDVTECKPAIPIARGSPPLHLHIIH